MNAGSDRLAIPATAMLAATALLAMLAGCVTTGPASPGPAQPAEPATTVGPPTAVRRPVQPPPPTVTAARRLVITLNDLIARRDFEGWKQHLSQGYIQRFSDPAHLAELSRAAVLRRSGIILRDLKGFFRFVVVPSRYNTAVQRIEQVAPLEVRVYAITTRGGAVLFHLSYEPAAGWLINAPFKDLAELPDD